MIVVSLFPVKQMKMKLKQQINLSSIFVVIQKYCNNKIVKFKKDCINDWPNLSMYRIRASSGARKSTMIFDK